MDNNPFDIMLTFHYQVANERNNESQEASFEEEQSPYASESNAPVHPNNNNNNNYISTKNPNNNNNTSNNDIPNEKIPRQNAMHSGSPKGDQRGREQLLSRINSLEEKVSLFEIGIDSFLSIVI